MKILNINKLIQTRNSFRYCSQRVYYNLPNLIQVKDFQIVIRLWNGFNFSVLFSSFSLPSIKICYSKTMIMGNFEKSSLIKKHE